MNLDDLTRRGLYLSDIPLHDATRDLVLLGEQFREEYKLTQELEILTDRLQHTLRALEDEKKKTDRSESKRVMRGCLGGAEVSADGLCSHGSIQPCISRRVGVPEINEQPWQFSRKRKFGSSAVPLFLLYLWKQNAANDRCHRRSFCKTGFFISILHRSLI